MSHRQKMIQRDKERILSPEKWPMYPWLPIKRTVGNELQNGVLRACDIVEGRYIAYEVGIQQLTKKNQNLRIKHVLHKTIDNLLEAGWIPD